MCAVNGYPVRRRTTVPCFAVSSSWLFLLILAAAISNSVVSELCSNKCSQQDKNLFCWNRTQAYYDQQLVAIMRTWVAVEIDIDQWRWRHNGRSPNNTINVDASFNRLSEYIGHPGDQRKEYLTVETIKDVSYSLVQRVNASSSTELLSEDVPIFYCPTECNYWSKLWLYCFIVSILANVGLIFMVVPFLLRSQRRDNQMKKLIVDARDRNTSRSAPQRF